jgi:hypothetical protein
MWIDPQGVQYVEKPIRVRLPDFTTRTSEAVTDELLYELGWTKIANTTPVQDVAEPAPDTMIIDSVGGA